MTEANGMIKAPSYEINSVIARKNHKTVCLVVKNGDIYEYSNSKERVLVDSLVCKPKMVVYQLDQ